MLSLEIDYSTTEEDLSTVLISNSNSILWLLLIWNDDNNNAETLSD